MRIRAIGLCDLFSLPLCDILLCLPYLKLCHNLFGVSEDDLGLVLVCAVQVIKWQHTLMGKREENSDLYVSIYYSLQYPLYIAFHMLKSLFVFVI